jgi:hypothetical protein
VKRIGIAVEAGIVAAKEAVLHTQKTQTTSMIILEESICWQHFIISSSSDKFRESTI